MLLGHCGHRTLVERYCAPGLANIDCTFAFGAISLIQCTGISKPTIPIFLHHYGHHKAHCQCLQIIDATMKASMELNWGSGKIFLSLGLGTHPPHPGSRHLGPVPPCIYFTHCKFYVYCPAAAITNTVPGPLDPFAYQELDDKLLPWVGLSVTHSLWMPPAYYIVPLVGLVNPLGSLQTTKLSCLLHLL